MPVEKSCFGKKPGPQHVSGELSCLRQRNDSIPCFDKRQWRWKRALLN